MFRTIFRSTIKGISRSALFRIAAGFLLVVSVFIRFGRRYAVPLGGDEFTSYIQYLPTLFTCAYMVQMIVMIALLPVFVVFALYDKDYDMYDVALSTGMSQRRYLAAKLSAFLAIYYISSLVLTGVNFLSYYVLDVVNAQIPAGETFLRVAMNFIWMSAPVGLFFVTLIACVTFATKNKAIGISIGGVYVLANHFVQGHFLSLPPSGIGAFIIEKQAVLRDILAPNNNPSAVKEMLANGEPLARYYSTDLMRVFRPDAAALQEILFYIGTGAALAVLLVYVLPRIRKNIFG